MNKEDGEQIKFERMEEEPHHPSTSYSEIIESLLDQIGLGKYQYIVGIVIGIVNIVDGGEILILSLLNYILLNNHQWNCSLEEVSMIHTFVFGSSLIGSIVAGLISDRYGRKKIFLYCLFGLFIASIASAMSTSILWLIITRGFFGISFGGLVPIANSLITEVCPRRVRGVMFCLTSSMFSVGELIILIMARLTKAEKDSSESWRFLLIGLSGLCILAIYLAQNKVEESFRFVISNDTQKGMEILNKMYTINHYRKGSLDVSENNKKQLNDHKFKKNKKLRSSVKILFKEGKWKTTLCLWSGWFTIAFTYFGITFLLPLINVKDSKISTKHLDYEAIQWSIIAELPSIILSTLIIENKYLGRQNSLSLCLILCSIFNLLSFLYPQNLIYWVFGSKFFISSAFKFIYPYTVELYHTKGRVTSLGFGIAMNRIGSALMPTIIIISRKIYGSISPFLIFAVLCGISSIFIKTISHDTTNINLDFENEQKYEEVQQNDEQS